MPRLVCLFLALAVCVGSLPASARITKKQNGEECVVDSSCDSGRCRPFPNGQTYCTSRDRTCSAPGGEGQKADAIVQLRGQCYQCKAGMGWKLCSSEVKQQLDNSR